MAVNFVVSLKVAHVMGLRRWDSPHVGNGSLSPVCCHALGVKDCVLRLQVLEWAPPGCLERGNVRDPLAFRPCVAPAGFDAAPKRSGFLGTAVAIDARFFRLPLDLPGVE